MESVYESGAMINGWPHGICQGIVPRNGWHQGIPRNSVYNDEMWNGLRTRPVSDNRLGSWLKLEVG